MYRPYIDSVQLFRTRCLCFPSVISQHTPVGLPFALVAGQNHSNSLLCEGFVPMLFCSCIRERQFLLDLSGSWVLGWSHSHDLILELSKESSLCRLGHIVSYHVAGGAPLYGELLFVDPIRDKLVTDVDVLCLLTAGSLAILLHKDGALVVLKDDVFLDPITLGIHEVSGPADGWHAVINSNNL